ncbi:NAD(P)H-hydrate dehydratase [Prosthecochloris sp. HL-130-GSB]|jgi:ADP-dependent NAD(P)H-hydrate dehydratase / NAD(P)H-hydrate epimerase|uniref:NAD(P)H-hydrate dehydratase n=1 Tax=Prosthecochloris sp. HL-130-GSB TaxID=1974213 RepID=UPI000A1C137B|nr:NAD(P)H-hydrate dehydratase [Prosthecochloris sp. HL-130-GSB]ARM30998.1 bifunctional ADP-dependent NAD(P)H-hydrate dehydratase/NAD(P)H-hydrate epimerase [Prosthecochloris sp. HL-130-GSB]
MKPILTGEEMALADRGAIEKLHTSETRLMELAGREASVIISDMVSPGSSSLDECSFLLVCGKGNNGGDGFVLARHLLNKGAAVDVLLLYPSPLLRDINRDGLAILEAYLPCYPGLRIFSSEEEALPYTAEQQYSAIIDAVLGTGLHLERNDTPLRDPVKAGIELINSYRTRTGSPVISLDLPSGLDATSGYASKPSVQADATITMAYKKTGFFFNSGPVLAGEVHTAEISIPECIVPPTCCRETDIGYASRCFPLRSPSSAKHTNGKVLVIAGSSSTTSSMTGAAILSTRAALACGAGYVCTSVPSEARTAIHTSVPAATVVSRERDILEEKIAWADAIVLGCGLGRTEMDRSLVTSLLSDPVMKKKKLVLDADALFAIASERLPLHEANLEDAVLTPHAGEFSRLSGLDTGIITSWPLEYLKEFSSDNKVSILLKGNPTLVASPDGTLHLNSSGTEALATAGTGDILAGMIGAFAARGLSAFDAASVAAWFHGRAGDLAGDISSLVTAEQVLDTISKAIEEIFSIEEQ